LGAVRAFAPFGAGNPQPEFLFENAVIESAKLFGKTKEHLELSIRDATGVATAFMFFAPGETCDRCVPGAVVSFLGTLEAGFRSGARVRIQKFL
jgi:single-stranded DNA-specific DHH superfamily exonuclease